MTSFMDANANLIRSDADALVNPAGHRRYNVDDLDSAIADVQKWNHHEKGVISPDHMETAWQHLPAKGWLVPVPVPS